MKTSKKIVISLTSYIIVGIYAACFLGSDSPNGPKNIIISVFGPFAAFSNFDIWSPPLLIASIVACSVMSAIVGVINHPAAYCIFCFIWIYIGYTCYGILAIG